MPTDLERLAIIIEANTKSYERAMVRLQKQTDQAIRGAGRSIKGLNTQLAAAASTARTFATALGAGIVAGGLAEIPGAIRAIVKEAADLGDEAERIGITTDRLQELNFQASQTGSSAETMGDALSKFSKNLAEARTGSGELYKLLKANGIALDDLAKMDVNQALDIFVGLLGNAADEADRGKIATIGFGKGGQELSLTFKGGIPVMREFANEAHRTWQVIDEFDIQQMRDIDDAFDNFTGTISTMLKQGLLDFLVTTKHEIEGIAAALDRLMGLRGKIVPPAVGPDKSVIKSGFDKRSRLVDQTFGAIEKMQKDQQLLDALQKKLSIAPGGNDDLGKPKGPTILPPAASSGRAASRDHAAEAAKREREQVADLIAELERERSLIGATDAQRRVSNELRQAGAAATDAQKQKITDLVLAIDAEEQAQDRLIDTLDTIRDTAGSTLDAFVQSIQAGEGPVKALKSALEDLLQTLIQIGEQMLIRQLFGAFGTTGAGVFGNAIGSLSAPALAAPARASAASAPVVQLQVVPGQMFVPVVTQIAGKVSVQAASAAESRAIARGPAVARNNQRRFGAP